MPALLFDLGGTHLRCGIARGDEVARAEKQRIETFLDGLRPEDVAERIAARISCYVASVENHVGPQDPVVLAFPGPIERRRVALAAPTLYGDTNGHIPDLAGLVRHRTGREIHVINDVSAAAWGLSRQTSASRFLVVTVSSGIGSKLFDRANPCGVLDEPSHSGEIGHYVVDPSPDAALCDCGGQGHLGAISSGRGVERLARRLRRDSSLTNEQHIVPAIRNGEAWALQILRLSMEPLARTLLAITMAAGLDRIFIIGGFAQAIGLPFSTMLRELIIGNSRYRVLEGRLADLVQLVGARDEFCLEGAACYAASLGWTK